jgi:taurine dioxygenase
MTTNNAATIEVVPSGAALGAEIRGVDLGAAPPAGVLDAIGAAWDEHLVLVLRGQRLEDAQLLAFSRHFGALDPPGANPYGEPFHNRHPELNVISNVVENGRPQGNLGDGEAVWHADMTYVVRPPRGAALYALEIPPGQGHTWFANMYAAFEALPAALARAIDGRVAVHDAAHNSAGMLRKGYREISDVRETPGARHPLVRTDPVSGRRCLFLGRRPRSWVVGLPVDESDALLDALWAHATQPRFAFVHRWQVGDLVMWQNLCVLHRRDSFDPRARRRLHRTQIRGEETIA